MGEFCTGLPCVRNSSGGSGESGSESGLETGTPSLREVQSVERMNATWAGSSEVTGGPAYPASQVWTGW